MWRATPMLVFACSGSSQLHTPSNLALETVSELQRQAAADFGIGLPDVDKIAEGAAIAEDLARFNGNPNTSWFRRFRNTLCDLRRMDTLTPYQDPLEPHGIALKFARNRAAIAPLNRCHDFALG